MSAQQTTRHGGAALVEALIEQRVEVVTCVPGESFLPVLDGLYDVRDRVRLVVAKHEAGAGSMAQAHGKLTGRAGVCLVTRGPGAMHAAIAVHTAQQDATPLVLMVGQVSTQSRGRGGFQEFDSALVFGSMAKAVLRLETAERIPEIVARAFRIAESGRPGPVVVDMPEEVLRAEVAAPAWPRLEPMRAAVAPADLAAVDALLGDARRPLIVVGRGPWSEQARRDLDAFATRHQVPVLAAFRCQDYIGTESSSYAGHLSFSLDAGLQALTADTDLVIAIGGQLGDVDTQGYELWSDPTGRPAIVQVVPDAVDANRHLPTSLTVLADGPAWVSAWQQSRIDRPEADPDWFERAVSEQVARSAPLPDDLLSGVMGHLNSRLPAEAVLCNGAGNYAVWVHRFGRYARYGTQVAPASGAMGYGLPAGVMAAVLDPERPVVVFAGDGCLMMSVQELSTIAEQRLNPVVIVVNNGIYGTIRMHQERAYPGRVSGTTVAGPDFVALAQACGFQARRAHSLAEFTQAWDAFQDTAAPRLIEIVTDPDLLAPGVRISTD